MLDIVFLLFYLIFDSKVLDFLVNDVGVKERVEEK